MGTSSCKICTKKKPLDYNGNKHYFHIHCNINFFLVLVCGLTCCVSFRRVRRLHVTSGFVVGLCYVVFKVINLVLAGVPFFLLARYVQVPMCTGVPFQIDCYKLRYSSQILSFDTQKKIIFDLTMSKHMSYGPYKL